MGLIIFRQGRRLILDGQEMLVVRIVNGHQVTLEDAETLALRMYELDDLLGLYHMRRLVAPNGRTDGSQVPPRILWRPMSDYPEAVQQLAFKRKRYLDALLAEGSIIWSPSTLMPRLNELARSFGDASPPSSSTAYRWYQRLQRGQNDPRALIDRHEEQGNFGCRFASPVQDALVSLIEEFYLSGPGCSIRELHAKLISHLEELKARSQDSQVLKLPSYDTVRRAVLAYPAYDRAVAKFGKQEASLRFRTSLAGPKAKYILEVAEIDHTPVDMFIIDEHSMLPLGRPLLTLLIDRKSRMILGVYVSFGGPSTEAVFQCLRHAILPKGYLKERYPRVEGNWPCFGLMETLVCDNGLEFHSKALEQACFELGIVLQFCPKKRPYFKGAVERAFRSISNGFFHVQKGTSLANWMQRHGYDPLSSAVATFDEFLHALHIWIVDVYSVNFHRGLQRTPLGVWQDGVHANPPGLPDLRILDTALMEYEERTLWHYGIELFKLRYNSRDLYPIRHQFGEKVRVQIRYNRADLGHVYVIHPSTGEAIKAPALEFDYASGLRLEVHELICRELREAGLSETDPLKRAQAKERMRQVIGEHLGNKKLQKRKRAARLNGSNSQAVNLATAQRSQSMQVEAPKVPRANVTPRQFKTSTHPWDKGGKP